MNSPLDHRNAINPTMAALSMMAFLVLTLPPAFFYATHWILNRPLDHRGILERAQLAKHGYIAIETPRTELREAMDAYIDAQAAKLTYGLNETPKRQGTALALQERFLAARERLLNASRTAAKAIDLEGSVWPTETKVAEDFALKKADERWALAFDTLSTMALQRSFLSALRQDESARHHGHK